MFSLYTCSLAPAVELYLAASEKAKHRLVSIQFFSHIDFENPDDVCYPHLLYAFTVRLCKKTHSDVRLIRLDKDG
jgi:hypothetical protein